MSRAVGRRSLLFFSFLFSQLCVLLVLRMPAVPGEGSWLESFRAYFSIDQLSYAAIATTAASGAGGLPEPFTETGTSYYPSLWYRLIGWVSATTGLSIPAVWSVLGYLLVAVAVAAVGVGAYRVSGYAWSPALVAPALMVGTLSTVMRDEWTVSLESHAIIWGPYASLYPLNAEVAGLSCVTIGLTIAIAVTIKPPALRRDRVVWLSLAAGLLGATANLQTYAFFVGTTVAFAWLGVLGLVKSRSRVLLAATAVVIVLTIVLGARLAQLIGGLPTFGLLIVCTLPGAGWVMKRYWRQLSIPAAAYALALVPQAAIVASGLLAGDEFLTYRQATSAELGVPWSSALVAALPILGVIAFNLAAQRLTSNDVVLSALVGLSFAGVMLTFNDAWGFAQEPYRMWIDSITVAAFMLVPLTAWSIRSCRECTVRGTARQVTISVGVIAAVVLALSLLDFGAFRNYVKQSGVIRFDTARTTSLAALTSETEGLLANGPCLDPQEFKLATRKPVTYYNLGVAWPARKSEMDAVMAAWRNGEFDPDALRAADVAYVVTDSACATQWPMDSAMGVTLVRSLDYTDEAGTGTLSLWRLY